MSWEYRNATVGGNLIQLFDGAPPIPFSGNGLTQEGHRRCAFVALEDTDITASSPLVVRVTSPYRDQATRAAALDSRVQPVVRLFPVNPTAAQADVIARIVGQQDETDDEPAWVDVRVQYVSRGVPGGTFWSVEVDWFHSLSN